MDEDSASWVDTGFLAQGYIDILVLLGLVFGLVTLIALFVALAQLRRTKNATSAANEATRSAVCSVRHKLISYSAMQARFYLRDTNAFVENENWSMAAVRVADTADRLAELKQAQFSSSDKISEVIEELRGWRHTFNGVESGKHKWSKSLIGKWASSSRDCSRLLDGFAAIVESAEFEGKIDEQR